MISNNNQNNQTPNSLSTQINEPNANQVTIRREELIKALQLIVSLSERKQMLPILSHVLVRVDNTRITFTASDSEIEVSSYLDCHAPAFWSKTPFAFTMPGKKVLDICRTLTENSKVELTVTQNLLHIISCESHFTLSVLSNSDFPLIDTEQASFQIELEYNEFRRLLNKVAFTVPQQDVRYYLTGVLLDFDTNYLQAIATDGHRLSAARIKLMQAVAENRQIIVPRRTVMELLRILSDNDEDTLALSCNQQYFKVMHPRFQLISKLIDGRFPNWKRIIPKKGEVVVRLTTEDFARSLQRVYLLINEVFRSVVLTFTPGWLQLASNNPGQEARDRLPLAYQGKSLTVVLNIEYLRDILKVVTTSEIILYLKHELSGIIIEEKDADEGNLYVVMPIKQQ